MHVTYTCFFVGSPSICAANKMSTIENPNLTCNSPWWWSQLEPEVQDLVKSKNFSYFCSLISSDDENMLTDIVFVLDCCVYAEPETKALVLYHMYRVSQKIVFGVISHTSNSEIRDEVFNLAVINGNLHIATKCLCVKNYPMEKLSILDLRYKNRIDELTDFLELLLDKSIVNLKWIKQKMLSELLQNNIDLSSSKFYIRLFVYLCNHFEIPYSPESISLQNQKRSYK